MPASPPTVDRLPERPQRAPGVRLCGRLRDSGFIDPPWLLRCDGRFLQLPEPVYRLVEAANGRRTLDELAARVAKRTGRALSPALVQALLVRQLLPLGILSDPAAPTSPATSAQLAALPARSPLGLRLKRPLLGPGLLDPCTRVLQGLYWPPLLVSVLLAAAVALRWLFVVHGVDGSVQAALRAPAQLLVVLALTVLGAAFHELGHATALRYGGGRAREVGVGLYLVYPAFYTDVSDAYRLGRWARVRTDLGGFYFNLLFILGLLSLYHLSGAPALLVAAALVVLDIVRQLLPFVRLDGYWALADLTGIPDFFTFLGPFVRSLVPGLGRYGAPLPPLRRWVRVVYALYVLGTVPLLALLLGELVRQLPQVVRGAGVAIAGLGLSWWAARRHGDLLGMLWALVQLLLLLPPLAGLGLVLGSVGRRLGRALWRVSRPTAPRRALGALGAAGGIALLVVLWVPQFRSPPAAQATPPVQRPAVAQGRTPTTPAPPPARTPAPAQLGPPAAAGADQPPAAPPGSPALVGLWQVSPTLPAASGEVLTRVQFFGDGHYCGYTTANTPRCGRYQLVPQTTGAQPGQPYTVTAVEHTLQLHTASGETVLLEPAGR